MVQIACCVALIRSGHYCIVTVLLNPQYCYSIVEPSLTQLLSCHPAAETKRCSCLSVTWTCSQERPRRRTKPPGIQKYTDDDMLDYLGITFSHKLNKTDFTWRWEEMPAHNWKATNYLLFLRLSRATVMMILRILRRRHPDSDDVWEELAGLWESNTIPIKHMLVMRWQRRSWGCWWSYGRNWSGAVEDKRCGCW